MSFKPGLQGLGRPIPHPAPAPVNVYLIKDGQVQVQGPQSFTNDCWSVCRPPAPALGPRLALASPSAAVRMRMAP